MSDALPQLGLTLLFSVLTCAAIYTILARSRVTGFAARFSLSRQTADRLFFALVILYALVLGTLSVFQQITFHGTGFDLAQYDQLIWNSLNGRLLENSLIPDAPMFLGKSFSPILLALVPLYAVWSNPIVLILVQTLALSAAAFPLYWLARDRLGHGLALVVTLTYFLSPVVEYLNLTQFYEITLATPLLMYACFFLMRRHDAGFFVCIGLALLVKEEIAFIVAAFGIFILLVQRRRWLGLAVALLGIVWGVILLQVILPFFRGPEYGASFYYFGNGVLGGGQTRYGYLGHDLSEIVATLLTRWDIVWQHVMIPGKIEFVLQLLVPLVFTSLLGIEVFALALPTFGYTLLSDFGFQYSITHAYTAPLLPFLFLSAAIGLKRLVDWQGWNALAPVRNRNSAVDRNARQIASGMMLLTASVASYFLQAPGPLAANFSPSNYPLTDHIALGYELMKQIPNDVTVVAQKEFVSSLSARQQIYEFPDAPNYRIADYLFGDKTRFWYSFHQVSWDDWLASGYFETLATQGDYIVAKRRPPEHLVNIHYGDQMTLTGYSIVLTHTLIGGETFRPIVEWRAEKSISQKYLFDVQLVDAQGHLWSQQDRQADEGVAPTEKWTPGKLIGDQFTLNLPPTMPMGDYQFAIGAHTANGDQYIDASDSQGKPIGQAPVVANVHVEKNKASITANQLFIPQPLYVDMAEMRFLGTPTMPSMIRAGDILQLGFYWRAREKPRGDYVVAAQLRDLNGKVIVEQSGRPANDTYPTTQWNAGEVLLDWHDLPVPQNLSTGNYQLAVLLRDKTSGALIGETFISSISVVKQ